MQVALTNAEAQRQLYLLWGGHAGTQSRAVSTLHAGGDCYSVAQGFRCVQGCVDGMRFAGMYDVISSAICR